MKTYILIFIFTLSVSLNAQNMRVIDLSNTNNHSETIRDNEKFQIKLINYNPFFQYKIKTELGYIEIPSLVFTIESFSVKTVNLYCEELSNLLNEFKTTDESDLENLITKIKVEIEKDSVLKNCSDNVIKAKNLIKKTVFIIDSNFNLKKGEQLKIVVERVLLSESDTNSKNQNKKWKHTYKTKSRGKWITSYGFTHITQNLDRENLYHLEKSDTDYKIVENTNRRDFSFVPTVLFTWMPNKRMNKNTSINLSAGLGYDLKAPTIFAGASLFYNQKVGFVFGLSVHQQQYLDGVYKPNQIIKELIPNDNLHKKHYTVNPFFSLTLDINDVFKKKTDKIKE